MTQREFFNAIVNGTLIVKEKDESGNITENKRSIFTENGFELTEEMKDFATTLIKKLDEKNRKRSEGMTAKQKDNEVIKTDILSLMSDGEKRSAKMITDAIENIKSTQQASALLKQLVDSGKLTSTTEKIGGSSSKVKAYVIV
jgi:predicted transcriptional regulator